MGAQPRQIESEWTPPDPPDSNTWDRETGEALQDFIDRWFDGLSLEVPFPGAAGDVIETEVQDVPGSIRTRRAAGESRQDFLDRHKAAVEAAIAAA